MAHIIQCKFFPEVQHPDIPYKTAELVAKFIYPTVGNSIDKVFALCDACLMTFHPGETFYNILIQMKKQNWNGDAKDIYDFVFKTIKADSKNICDIFKEKSDEASQQLQDYFTTNIFDAEKNWVKTVLEVAKNIRVSNPSFLLDILSEASMPSQKFTDLFTELGTPLMMNYVGDAWFHPPKTVNNPTSIQPDRMASIYEVFRLFEYGHKNCELKHYCMATVNVDKRCNHEPWTRYNDSNLCAYGQFWKTWELFNKTPV